MVMKQTLVDLTVCLLEKATVSLTSEFHIGKLENLAVPSFVVAVDVPLYI